MWFRLSRRCVSWADDKGLAEETLDRYRFADGISLYRTDAGCTQVIDCGMGLRELGHGADEYLQKRQIFLRALAAASAKPLGTLSELRGPSLCRLVDEQGDQLLGPVDTVGQGLLNIRGLGWT